MAKRTADKELAVTSDVGWLSLKKAARLCQTTPRALKTRIMSGELHAFTIERGGRTRFRVSRAALVNAGLLGKEPALEAPTATVDILALIRDQNQRISDLEDQRAVLSGQLGMALERLRTIDERLSSIEALPSAGDSVDRAETAVVVQHSNDVLLRSIFKALPIPGTSRWRREAPG